MRWDVKPIKLRTTNARYSSRWPFDWLHENEWAKQRFFMPPNATIGGGSDQLDQCILLRCTAIRCITNLTINDCQVYRYSIW